jgi:hypothetical protein
MKRLLVPVLAGLLGGLLAGTGVGAVRGRAAALAEMDSLAATDSLVALEAERAAAVEPVVEPVREEAHGPVEADVAGSAADGTTAAPSRADTTVAQAPGGAAESAASPEAPTGPSGPARSAGAGRAASSPSAGEGGGTPPSAPDAASATTAAAAREEGSRRLAKIFGAMRAEDAAGVLVGLTDDDVKAILTHVSDRRAAAILAELPPERAASLSRVVLLSSLSGRAGEPAATDGGDAVAGRPGGNGESRSQGDATPGAAGAAPTRSAPAPDAGSGAPADEPPEVMIPTGPDAALLDSIRFQSERLDALDFDGLVRLLDRADSARVGERGSGR